MDILTICILVSVVSATNGRFPLSSEGQIRNFLFNQANYSSRDRPVLDSSRSVEVGMSMQFYALLELNEREESISTTSWLSLRWRDERFTWDPEDFGGTDLILVSGDDVWTPILYLTNSLETNNQGILSSPRSKILVTSSGTMQLGGALIQSTKCPVNVVYFPFDSQVCRFSFMPENQIEEHITLYADSNLFVSHLESNQWDLLKVTATNATYYDVPDYVENRLVSNHTKVSFCIFLKRDPSYYIQTLIIPSTLLCALAFATFLAPPDSGERISLGVSMVLGLTVFQLLVSETLPAASKNTPLLSDQLVANFIMACLAVPFSLFNINIAYGDSPFSSMKRHWLRKAFLETLPVMLFVTPYGDRLREETVNEIEVQPSTETNSDEESNVGDSDVKKVTKVKRNQIEQMLDNIPQKELKSVDKKNMQARTVALVMDRLILILFTVVFLLIAILVILEFQKNKGVLDDDCESFA
ncbi:acetylcholine receptor subunit beta-type acr-3-like [Apostichopus japonicus]|uniref:acetylcholine receptor subunit beta-type acr-3-like n=1 Tax=Stichopus japonicus TaxID=307972 RepID=UPI003AB2876E